MAKIITTDEQLRLLIPNTLVNVKGETPLFDKLAPFLDLAEEWVRSTFTSESTYNTICGYTDSNALKLITARLVVTDALRRAVPSLDVVLTPNGFATVGTANLVAASKARVDRLIGSLAVECDRLIARLLTELPGASKWLTSKQAEFFGGSLFPTLDLCDTLSVPLGQQWQKYLELRPQVIDLEDGLAEDYFSPELMAVLRDRKLHNSLQADDIRLVAAIRAQVVAYLQGGTINARRMVDMVQYVRERPESFPQWHESATASLFSPPKFRNQKKSPGYWF